MNLKKTLLSTAVVTTLGISSLGFSASASADVISMDFEGLFTILDSGGAPIVNSSLPYSYDPTWEYGKRTPISGTMTFDTATGAGSGTLNSFEFFGGSLPAEATGINLQAIGDGMGSQNGTLVLVNMLFNWNGTDGIPVSLVLDAAGFFAASGAPPGTNVQVGDVIDGSNFGFATSATDASKKYSNIQLGGIPIATTSWDTTPLCNTTAPANNGNCLGVSPIGTFPLLPGASDPLGNPISSSPMVDGPFSGSNASFDVTTLTITSVTPIPVPAAVWLFGSGLLGLVGVARRRKQQ